MTDTKINISTVPELVVPIFILVFVTHVHTTNIHMNIQCMQTLERVGKTAFPH